MIATHGEHSLPVASGRLGHGIALAADGRLSGAEQEAAEAVRIRSELLGDTHRDTVLARSLLMDFLLRQEKWPMAAAQSRAIIAAAPSEEARLPSRYNLANCLRHMGERAESDRLLREVLAGSESAFGADHMLTQACRTALAGA